MLTAVKGYYDGRGVVINKEDRGALKRGQELIITVLGFSNPTEDRGKRRRDFIRSKKCVIPSERTAEEIDKGIEELRNDRF